MNLHPAELTDERLLADCQFVQTRGSGPGGQHRNKVSTGVVLEHRPSGVRGSALESRSQIVNRDAALQRLRWNLAVQCRAAVTAERVERLHRYVQGGLLRIADGNPDQPAAAALILDAAALDDSADLGALARAWQTTATQLTRFLAKHPPALEALNTRRIACGRRPLR
jgi:hypothetical protein